MVLLKNSQDYKFLTRFINSLHRVFFKVSVIKESSCSHDLIWKHDHSVLSADCKNNLCSSDWVRFNILRAYQRLCFAYHQKYQFIIIVFMSYWALNWYNFPFIINYIISLLMANIKNWFLPRMTKLTKKLYSCKLYARAWMGL